MSSRKFFIGADHAGFSLKAEILRRLAKDHPDLEVVDCGTKSSESTDYPVFAKEVGIQVAQTGGRGLLICGSGIGMSIAANKVPGVRAAVVWDVTSARLACQHNGANVVCVGTRLVGEQVVFDILETFLKTPFEEGRHAKRLELIQKMEQS